jgi:ribosomal protein L21E
MQWVNQRDNHRVMLQEQLLKAQQRYKHFADLKSRLREFQVGEQVLLKLQPYALHSMVNRSCPKLAFKFFGPYTVLEKIGEVAYKIQLPEDAQIHLVFHVSQLKPFTPSYVPVFSELPKVMDLGQEDVQPMDILDKHLVKKGRAIITQVLIKWSDLQVAANTWEDYNVIRARFLDALTWGQASIPGGANVTAEGDQ